MLSDSDLVVQATLAQAPTLLNLAGGGTDTRIVATNVSRFAGQGTAPPSSLIIVETSDVRSMFSTPGTYVLFLGKVQPDPVSGAAAYAIVDGMYGMFPIQNGTVSMHCPNYQKPSAPLTASGANVSLDSFRSLIATTSPLPPLAPKPGMTTRPPN